MRLLRLNAVKEATGLSTASIYKAIAAGQFPRSVAISSRARGWLDSDIQQWIEERVTESRDVSAQGVDHD
jgi:prophage regulatory protein